MLPWVTLNATLSYATPHCEFATPSTNGNLSVVEDAETDNKDMNPDWDDYRHFAAIVHAGSVRAAAQQLEVNASTVTRRLDHLERRLGIALFTRTPQGLVITRQGEELAERIDRISREIVSIESELQAGERADAGRVSLLLPKSLHIILTPRLDQFRLLHPLIDIEIINPLAQIPTGQIDITIRGTQTPDADLIARSLGRPQVGVFARPDVAELMLPGQKKSAIGWLSLLDQDLGPGVDDALRNDGFAGLAVNVRTTSVLQQLVALRAGLGVGMLPRWMIGDASGLVEIPSAHSHQAQPFWLLSRPAMRRALRAQLLLDWLRSELADPLYGFVRGGAS